MDQIKDRPYSDRALIKLLLPIIIERLLAATVGLADSLMVASVGEAAVSAVSLVDSVNVLFIDLCSFRAIGPAVMRFLLPQREAENQSHQAIRGRNL